MWDRAAYGCRSKSASSGLGCSLSCKPSVLVTHSAVKAAVCSIYYYPFAGRGGMEGWVGLVGWPIANSSPTQWSPASNKLDAGQESTWCQKKTDVLTTEPRRQPGAGNKQCRYHLVPCHSRRPNLVQVTSRPPSDSATVSDTSLARDL